MKEKVKRTIELINSTEYLKKEVLIALKEAASKFADDYEDEKLIAEEIFKLIKVS